MTASGSTDLIEEIRSTEWYHTIDLGDGLVTPGWFDTRQVVPQIPFPSSLEGKRCLDVGTFDGFWAFEMERRGASEVIAVDILDAEKWDWPASSSDDAKREIGRRKGVGHGFEIVHRELRSSVVRLEKSVYDLSEAELGRFDLVYVGSLLIHLRDPVRALERLRSVCSGQAIIVDNIDLVMSILLPHRPVATLDGNGRPWWWNFNEAGLRRAIEAGGFEVVDGPRRIFMPRGPGQSTFKFQPILLRTRIGRQEMINAYRGDPHGVVVARPIQ